MQPKGGLSLDDTVVTHEGHPFDQMASLSDAAQQGDVWAHPLVTLHDSDDHPDYPVDFRLWAPAELASIATGLMAAGMTLRPSQVGLKDHAPNRFVDKTLKVPSGGPRARDKLVVFKQKQQRLDAFDAHRQQEHHQAITNDGQPVFRQLSIASQGDQETDDSSGKPQRLPHVGTPRVVIKHRQADRSASATDVISNPLQWPAQRITRIRRHRWPVDVSHEEGHAAGLDQAHGRAFAAIARPIALVAVTDR
jgi:hypothetical protein